MRRILWFRRDLRLEDNPLLSLEGEVLPIFIFDTHILQSLERDDRRVSFIFEAVLALKDALKTQKGLELAIFYGKPEKVFTQLLSRVEADEVCASMDYDSYARERDRKISHLLPFNALHDTYIFRPDEVLKNDGTPYLVYTPYYKRAKALFTPAHLREVNAVNQTLIPYAYDGLHDLTASVPGISDISLEAIGFEQTQHHILPVAQLLDAFKVTLPDYSTGRDYLAKDATSHLSPHLRFGTLGVRQLLRWLVEQKQAGIDTEPFFRQLLFRDFYAYLLYHFPDLEHANFRYPFKGIEQPRYYEAFCNAQTGVPIVDAGIRELLDTGNMHNRVRMICASFFTKDLLLPWQWGESFFAKHLNDYDAASNILSWQWSAGTGIDPQPYFRIFNPYRQSATFDKDAFYIKKWLPQLAELPAAALHDEAYLSAATIKGYPKPIVVHAEAAKKAKDYFKNMLR